MEESVKPPKYRTISLSDERPVMIDEHLWPVIASASDHDNEHESQAKRRWGLKVRQHADGRSIVYGTHSSQFRDERDLHGGYRVVAGDADELVASIRRVAEEIGCPELASDCIADLPAVELE